MNTRKTNGARNKRNGIGEQLMTNQLTINYTDKAQRLTALEKELTALEKLLKTPFRGTDDMVRHMELLKEYNELITGESDN